MSGKRGRHRTAGSRHAASAAVPSAAASSGSSSAVSAAAASPSAASPSAASPSALSLVDRGDGSDAWPESGSRTATLERPAATPSFDVIAPDRLGSRRAARLEKRDRRRKRLLVVCGAVCVVALIAWAVVAVTGGRSPKHRAASAAAHGRTQTTMLVQIQDPHGAAVDSALVAHDSAQHAGVVILVPSTVIAQVPGFGSMPFGQASTLGQSAAPRATLSDLIHVDVDGSWVLTTKALQALVDKVGGVTVSVDKDVTQPGPNGTTKIVVPAGNARLNGAQAAAFATFLDQGETEQARLARFDAVLNAALSQLPKQPTDIAHVISALGTGSISSFPAARLGDLLAGLAADNAANETTDTILPVKSLDTGNGQGAFSVDAPATATFISEHLAQSMPPNSKATGNRVMVENQVGTPGIGETTRQKLLNASFVYIPGQNAPGMPNATAPSVVLIQGTTAADIATGDKVAKALGLPASDVKVSPQHISVADVIVLLGADYKP